jgi:hypothetical protein
MKLIKLSMMATAFFALVPHSAMAVGKDSGDDARKGVIVCTREEAARLVKLAQANDVEPAAAKQVDTAGTGAANAQ